MAGGKNMKILITGCNGYIGQHLCKMLSDTEHELHGIDLHEKSTTTYLTDYHSIDIRESFNLPEAYDIVIHLAALVRVGESVEFPIKYYETNITGTRNLLESVNFKQFIFGSTGAASTPTSPYAVSKVVAESYIQDYCQTNDIPFTTFRFYNVIGTDGFEATNPDGLFFKLNEAVQTGIFYIYGHDYNTDDGTALRDYVHVNEICSSIISSFDEPSNQIENLGHGVGFSVWQIAESFKQVNAVGYVTKLAPRREGDPEKAVLDNVSKFMKTMYRWEEYLEINKIN
jgi:UDP-glucose 4-epimerase